VRERGAVFGERNPARWQYSALLVEVSRAHQNGRNPPGFQSGDLNPEPHAWLRQRRQSTAMINRLASSPSYGCVMAPMSPSCRNENQRRYRPSDRGGTRFLGNRLMRLYLDASMIIYAVESQPPFRDTVIARIMQAERTVGGISLPRCCRDLSAESSPSARQMTAYWGSTKSFSHGVWLGSQRSLQLSLSEPLTCALVVA
jgi:hypothetical protein